MTNFRTNRPDSANKVERRRLNRNRSGSAPKPPSPPVRMTYGHSGYQTLASGTYDRVGTKRRDAGPIGGPFSHGRAVRINDEMSKCHVGYASLVKHPNSRAQVYRGADSGIAGVSTIVMGVLPSPGVRVRNRTRNLGTGGDQTALPDRRCAACPAR